MSLYSAVLKRASTQFLAVVGLAFVFDRAIEVFADVSFNGRYKQVSTQRVKI